MHSRCNGPRAQRGAVLLVAAVALLVTSCSPSPPEAIANDACELAEDVMSSDVGTVGALIRAQRIIRDARNADVTVEELLAEAEGICPEVVDALPFDEGELPSLGELREQLDGLSGLQDQLDGIDLEDLDLENLDLGDLDLENLDLGDLDLRDIDLERLQEYRDAQ